MTELDLDLPGGDAVAKVFGPDADSMELLTEMLDWLTEPRPVAFDVETTSLDFSDPDERLRWVQIGDRDTAYVIHPSHAKILRSVLAAIETPVAHNGLFDAAWLHHRANVKGMAGVVRRMIDTQTVAFLYDPRKAIMGDPSSAWTDDDAEAPVGLGLKACSVQYVGDGADIYELGLAEQFELPGSHGKLWAKAWNLIPDDDETFLRYSAADVVLTCRLLDALWPRLEDHERDVLYPIEQSVQFEAFRIMRDGLHVDIEACRVASERLLKFSNERSAELLDRFGLKNPNSPKQVVELMERLGAPLTLRTKTGAWSVDRNVLEGLAESSDPKIAEVAGLIREAKQSRRYATTYADKLAASGGVVYPAIRTVGATTGRWTIANPPIQQWPKQPYKISDTETVSMRGLFVPRPGKLLIACDLNSIEVVVGASVSDDEHLLDTVDGDLDRKITVYDDLARELGVERKQAKTVFLAGQYGSGAGKMAVALGTDDLYEVKRMKAKAFGGSWCTDRTCHRDYRDTGAFADCMDDDHVAFEEGFYGGIRAFTKRLTDNVDQLPHRDGWPGVPNVYGRWVPAAVEGRSPKPNFFPTFNHVVQGSARDLLMRMLIEASDRGLRPWLTVHDEIIIEVDEASATEAQAELIDVMTRERDPDLELPIRSECDDPSERWGG